MKDSIRICPNCGSSKVKPSENVWIGTANILNANSWDCKNCGYCGVMPKGDPDEFDESEIAFDEKKQSEGLNSGKASLNIGNIQIIFLVILGIFFLLMEIL